MTAGRDESPAERLVLRVLTRLHREQPLVEGFRVEAVVARVLAEAARSSLPSSHRGGGQLRLDAAAVNELLVAMEARGLVARAGRRVALPGRRPSLDPETRRRADALLAEMRAAGMRPPPIRVLARHAGLPDAVLEYLRQTGELVSVAPDVDYPADTLRAAEQRFHELAAAEGGVSAAAFRDALGAGRRHAVALLEFFDATGVSTREGGMRRPAVRGALGGLPSTSDHGPAKHDTQAVP